MEFLKHGFKLLTPLRSSFLLLILLSVLPFASRAEVNFSRDQQLKAAFFHKFLGFLDWDTSISAPKGESSSLCVLGENSMSVLLKELLEETDEHLDVIELQSPEQGRSCKLIYISASEKDQLDQVLSALDGSGTATVSDMPHFIDRGGMIQFIIDDTHVRFVINEGAAARQGIRISSQLLALAKRRIE
jgi:hypothetical protein